MKARRIFKQRLRLETAAATQWLISRVDAMNWLAAYHERERLEGFNLDMLDASGYRRESR